MFYLPLKRCANGADKTQVINGTPYLFGGDGFTTQINGTPGFFPEPNFLPKPIRQEISINGTPGILTGHYQIIGTVAAPSLTLCVPTFHVTN